MALAAALAGACGSGGGAAAAKPACRERLIDQRYAGAAGTALPLARKLYRGLRAPGVQVAVAVRGKVVWRLACGWADLRAKRAVTAATRFRIGSVTKPLTGVALAQLADAHVVDVDAPIQRYVPEFPRKEGEITLRKLGGHLAGIRHYETRAEVVNRRHFDSPSNALSVFADDPSVAPPGSRFAYSSYGFVLIGAALERAADTAYGTLMEREVLKPARMTHTRLGTQPVAGSATFYEITDSGAVRRAPPIDLTDRLPAAGYVSTASDLAQFGSALPRLLSAAGRTLLFTPQKARDGRSTGYGVGFETHSSPYGRMVGHTGSVVGGTSGLLVNPSSQAAIALTTNLGYVTAASPPPPAKGTPDPPQLLVPFIRARA